MISIFVPRLNSQIRCRLIRGSAVVGDKAMTDEGGQITVYFEGNQYAAVNINNYADRVLLASLRLRDRAATVARVTIDQAELIEIGWWDEENGRAIIDPDKRHELDYWLSYQIRDTELTTTAQLSH